MSRVALLIAVLTFSLAGVLGYYFLQPEAAREGPWVVKEVRTGGSWVGLLTLSRADDPSSRQECALYGLRFPPEELGGLVEQSNEALAALVQGKEVTFQVQNPAPSQTKGETTIKFGFDACDVRVGDILVNEELIRLGWARAEEGFYGLMDAEEEAQREGVGLWGDEVKEQVRTWFIRTEGFEKVGLKPPFQVSVEWAQKYPAWRRRVLQYFALDVDDFAAVVDEAGNKVENWREAK